MGSFWLAEACVEIKKAQKNIEDEDLHGLRSHSAALRVRNMDLAGTGNCTTQAHMGTDGSAHAPGTVQDWRGLGNEQCYDEECLEVANSGDTHCQKACAMDRACCENGALSVALGGIIWGC